MSHTQCTDIVNEHFHGDKDNMEEMDIDIEHDNESESDETEMVNDQYMEEEEVDSSDVDDSDENGSDSDMFADDEEVEVKTYLATRKIEDIVKEELNLPDEIRNSRYYRRAKKKYFIQITESKTVSELLSQLTQVPEAVSVITCTLYNLVLPLGTLKNLF